MVCLFTSAAYVAISDQTVWWERQMRLDAFIAASCDTESNISRLATATYMSATNKRNELRQKLRENSRMRPQRFSEQKVKISVSTIVWNHKTNDTSQFHSERKSLTYPTENLLTCLHSNLITFVNHLHLLSKLRVHNKQFLNHVNRKLLNTERTMPQTNATASLQTSNKCRQNFNKKKTFY